MRIFLREILQRGIKIKQKTEKGGRWKKENRNEDSFLHSKLLSTKYRDEKQKSSKTYSPGHTGV